MTSSSHPCRSASDRPAGRHHRAAESDLPPDPFDIGLLMEFGRPLGRDDQEEQARVREAKHWDHLSRIVKLVDRIRKEPLHFRLSRRDPGLIICDSKFKPFFMNLDMPAIGLLFQFFAEHKLHPYVEAFWRCFGPLNPVGRLNGGYPCRELAEQSVNELNQAVLRLREIVTSPAVRRQVDNLRRTTAANLVSLRRYVRSICESRSRVMLVRVDLSYGKGLSLHQMHSTATDAPTGEGGLKVDPTPDRPVSWRDVVRHREELLREVRKGFRGKLLGYIWKLEYGVQKGYHFHMAFLMDGSKVREDISIGRVIGECWKTAITGGRGLYYNCNADKAHYRYLCLGDLSQQMPELQKGLDLLTAYLAKPDGYVRLELPARQRTMGKGGAPRQKKTRKRVLRGSRRAAGTRRAAGAAVSA